MRRLLLVCLALASTCSFGQTYRWIDASGRTVFSDTPPPGKVKSVVKAEDDKESGDALPFAVKKAAENFPVILYTATNCTIECKLARDLLNGRGVPFTEKMVQKKEEIDELTQLVGDNIIPSIKVGKQSSRGFEASAYNNLLDLAGYPKSAPYGSKPAGGLSK